MLIRLAAIECLRSESVLTTTGPSHSQHSFFTVRISIFKHSKTILAAAQQQSPATGVHIDPSAFNSAQALNGFFTLHVVCDMLEAKDFLALDRVFLFIATFFNRCCTRVPSALTTYVFTMYSDLFIFEMR